MAKYNDRVINSMFRCQELTEVNDEYAIPFNEGGIQILDENKMVHEVLQSQTEGLAGAFYIVDFEDGRELIDATLFEAGITNE
jgi:hypothetical protein